MSFTESSQKDAKNRIPKSKNIPKYHHIMCFGTFDLFHPGHEYYLSEARALAGRMTIVIARDSRVLSGKGRAPIHDEATRRDRVQVVMTEATVVLGDEVDIFTPIRAYSPDVLAFGYDQRVPEEKLYTSFPDMKMVRIGGYETDKWKSSLLRAEKEYNTKSI